MKVSPAFRSFYLYEITWKERLTSGALKGMWVDKALRVTDDSHYRVFSALEEQEKTDENIRRVDSTQIM